MVDGFLGIPQVNHALADFVYGLVFFSLGLAIAVNSRGGSQLDLANQLSWLAAFGFTRSVHEWSRLFIPLQAAYLPPTSIAILDALRIVLLALSFFFLGQFGAMVAIPIHRFRVATRLAFGALLVFFIAWVLTLPAAMDAGRFMAADAWIRRTMALPAAGLAAFGMLRQPGLVAGGRLPGITRDFRVAAVAFAAYAFLAGLPVSSDPLVDQWSAYGLKADFLDLPAPLLRSIVGLGLLVGLLRGLRVFETETDRRLEEAQRTRFAASERARAVVDAITATTGDHQDPARLPEVALSQIIALVGASAGWLVLACPDVGTMEFQVGRGLMPMPAPGQRCAPKGACPCHIAMEKEEVTVSLLGDGCCLQPLGIPESVWTSVPLVADGRAVGVLQLVGGDSRPETLGLLASLGRQLGLAVENAELEREIARKEAARAQLLRKVITAQEEERRRVARELHDQAGQSLTAVIMALGMVGERVARGPRVVSSMVDEAREVAVQALDSTREMIMELRPAALDDLGLVPALRRFSEDLARKGDLEIDVEANGLVRGLPGDVEIVLFRILQESLHNVLRHSQARRAAVHLTCTAVEVCAQVVDDGIGFDPSEAMARPDSGRGLGLLGMKERAALLDGEVTVESAPNAGTRVLVRIPLSGGAEHE